MGKAVLISIRPKWCYLIASRTKTIEVRKTKPKIDTPFKCYIYQTLPKSGDWNERDGHVIGEFVCDDIYEIDAERGKTLGEAVKGIAAYRLLRDACLTAYDLLDYLSAGENSTLEYRTGYGWHISDLWLYDQPKKLSEFNGICSKKALTDCECESCKRLLETGIGHCPLDWIKNAPQSWRYVEELTNV